MSDDRYTHGHHDSVLRSHRARTVQNSAQYLLPKLNRGSTLLDVGCGPGTLTADLAAEVAPGRVVALEREQAVLEEARAVCAERLLDNVDFLIGDVYALDFGDQEFDVVHAHQVLQHLSDPVAALVEMRRVVRHGGVVAARDADYSAMTWYPPDPRLDLWLGLYQTVARRNRAEPDAGRQLLAWANQAGFDTVQPTASVWCFAAAETRRWWGELWAERMTGSAIADQATAEGLADDSDLQEIGQAFRDWSGHPDAWFAVLHGEIVATR